MKEPATREFTVVVDGMAWRGTLDEMLVQHTEANLMDTNHARVWRRAIVEAFAARLRELSDFPSGAIAGTIALPRGDS